MTSQFWKWLSRSNARAVLLAAAIVFLAVSAYWVWRELDEPSAEAGYGAGAGAGAGLALTNKVQLLAFIRIQQQNQEKVPSNPYYRKPPSRPEGGRAGAKGSDPGKVSPKPPPAQPPPPPASVKETPVRYRGILFRPDGRAVALIENQETKKQRYFAEGETFLKATIETIGTDSVSLRRPDGRTWALTRGRVERLRED
ncbi:MAG: hypothetical protein R6X19_10550 [Kiritimatiellia bacterium]